METGDQPKPAQQRQSKGPIEQRIETKLAEHFQPDHLEVVNESGNHNVPAGSESHFKVILVSETFAGATRIARHRQVHGVLADELAQNIHALAIHAYSGADWQKRFGDAPLSPPCLGGDGTLPAAAPS